MGGLLAAGPSSCWLLVAGHKEVDMTNKLLITFIFALVFSFACARPNGLVGPAGASKIKASNTSLEDRGNHRQHSRHSRP